jgi:hypothetical protein
MRGSVMKTTSQLKRSGFRKPSFEEVIKKQKAKKKVVKKKPKTIGYYKKKLWTEFSIFIRRRDKGKCFTCTTHRPWKEMQAGHMIPRSIGGLLLYFHEKNVHCQCIQCNIHSGGNGAIYAKNFLEKYGQEEFDEIIRMRYAVAPHMTPKEKIAWYLEKIDHYKKINKEYEKTNTQ